MFDRLRTPALLVDRRRIVANCDAMREKARRSGVLFRPHVKTHKSVEIAKMQHGGAVGPITVSSLAEARLFGEAGFNDITYAIPIAPQKLSEVAELGRLAVKCKILVDHVEALEAVTSFASAHGTSFDCFVKIDCGYHRAGVEPDSAMMRAIADRLKGAEGVKLAGVLTHAGHAYHARDSEEILAIARDETAAVTRAAVLLHEHGFPEVVRSVGSTPTASTVERFDDCDEVRPGNYVFYDEFQRQLGTCRAEDCAITVLTTVIGIYQQEGKVIVDAGSLAITRESPYRSEGPATFGRVLTAEGRELPLVFRSMSQEHGQLFATNADLPYLRIGDRLRIVPNHSCITAAMFDRYHVVEHGRVIDEWRPARGW